MRTKVTLSNEFRLIHRDFNKVPAGNSLQLLLLRDNSNTARVYIHSDGGYNEYLGWGDEISMRDLSYCIDDKSFTRLCTSVSALCYKAPWWVEIFYKKVELNSPWEAHY